MERTRRSFYYPVTYLLAGGLGLLVAPQFTLSLMLSVGDFGHGVSAICRRVDRGLGIVVAQIARHPRGPFTRRSPRRAFSSAPVTRFLLGKATTHSSSYDL
jgi:hypothetical protein